MGDRVRSGRSVLQDWVMELPLRHQGVLVAAVRGCDTAVRHDDSKLLARCLRAAILVAATDRPTSFIEHVGERLLRERMEKFLNSWDHYPNHYNMHVVHAAEIIAYHGPEDIRKVWHDFYFAACRRLHLTPETVYELNARLCADEPEFRAQQDTRLL